MIQIIKIITGQILISQIEEVGSELGEPDCKLIKPYLLNDEGTMHPWMENFTSQDTFMIHSDKILTLSEPRPTILEQYQKLIK